MALPPAGQLSFATTYAVPAYRNSKVIAAGDYEYAVTADREKRSETMILTADLGLGTVSSEDKNPRLETIIKGNDLSGIVKYVGLTGILESRMSEDFLQSAFHKQGRSGVFLGEIQGENALQN
jgi:hypothetical protein